MTDERGSAGVLVAAGMMAAVLGVFVVGVVLINWFSALRGAEQAAELSALAAVSASVDGGDARRAAGEAARRNGATLGECVVRGSGRHVVVEVSVIARLEPALPGSPAQVQRSAAAGTG